MIAIHSYIHTHTTTAQILAYYSMSNTNSEEVKYETELVFHKSIYSLYRGTPILDTLFFTKRTGHLKILFL